MGKTILLSSHILPELSSICNRVGIIARGNLLAVGSLEEVSAAVAPPRIHLGIGEIESPEEQLSRAIGHPVHWDHEAQLWSVDLAQFPTLTAPEIAHRVVSSGIPLTKLQPVQASLEEVFLTLTEELALGSEEEGA